MKDNFYIYVDRGGKMPQLKYRKWTSETHPHYVRYANNRPVAYHGPLDVVATKITTDGSLCFWDYSRSEFVPASNAKPE